MANEAKKTWATTINHIVDGAQVTASTGWSTSSDIDTALSSTNLLDYPQCDIVLHVNFGSAPTAGGVIELYRRDVNITGTNDAPIPDANYPYKLVGVALVDNAAGEQWLPFNGVPLAKECEFYIANKCSQNIDGSGTPWDLDVKPWTYVPAS